MAPTFAFIVIATKDQPWQRVLRQGPERTWVKNLGKGEHYLAAYSDGTLGNSKVDETNHQQIIFDSPRKSSWEITEPSFFRENHANFTAHAGYGGLIPTTISSVSYLQEEHDPDFIIRTNVSSYWNLNALRKLLTALPRSEVYAGVTGAAYGGVPGFLDRSRYVSGAGMIMSKDVYRQLILERNRFDLTCIDDLSIGRTFSSLGIKPMEASRIDLRHIWDIKQIPTISLSENAHFRCKSEHKVGKLEVRRDASLMRHLHEVLNGVE
jgi:hypothetical protein